MTLQKSETRDPSAGSGQAVAQARRLAAAAIEKQAGPARELYDYNRSLAEAFWPEISPFHAAWMARVTSELGLDVRGARSSGTRGVPTSPSKASPAS